MLLGTYVCRALVFSRVDGGQVGAVGGADALGVTATAPAQSSKEDFPGEEDRRLPGNVVYYVI